MSKKLGASGRGRVETSTRPSALPLTVLVVLFVAAFIVWADRAVIDQIARGAATVVPAKEIQQVSHLEGGILEALNVEEGEAVRRDEVVARVKNTRTRADFEAARAKRAALRVRLARLDAELADAAFDGAAAPVPGAATVAEAERLVLDLRRRHGAAQREALNLAAEQKRGELAEQRAQLRYLRSQQRLAQQEIGMLQPLVESGAAARSDLIDVRRTVSDLRGQIDAVSNAIPRTESALEEVLRDLEQLATEQRVRTLGELNQTREEVDRLTAQLTAEADRVARTEIRSPVDGTVKSVAIPTLGGVVESGETILEIVPTTERLLVEARIPPEDVAFLRPGQAAVVKISAYDFAIYGGLDGVVEDISADTFIDEVTEEEYYEVRVRTDANAIRHEGEAYAIRPGMTGSVDILTGEETVLDIALAPVRELAERALRER
jgi:adhesin transport system membrane fusion protein